MNFTENSSILQKKRRSGERIQYSKWGLSIEEYIRHILVSMMSSMMTCLYCVHMIEHCSTSWDWRYLFGSYVGAHMFEVDADVLR